MRHLPCKLLAGNSPLQIISRFFFAAIRLVTHFDLEFEAMASEIPRDEETPLLVVANNPKNHTKDVHILSVAFLLIFLAYGAAQNLQSTLNTVSLGEFFFPVRLKYLLYFNFDSDFAFEFSVSGGELGYDFTWGFVYVFHCFLSGRFFGGSGTRVEECFGSRHNWLFVLCSCKLEAQLVINRYLQFYATNLWACVKNGNTILIEGFNNSRRRGEDEI